MLVLVSLSIRLPGLLFCGALLSCSGDLTPSPGEGAPADSGAEGAAFRDPDPCGHGTIQPGTFPLDFGGNQYRYLVHLPPSYDGRTRTPLVLNWHSFTASALKEEQWTGMDAVSDEDGFILVYPDSPDGTWNAGTCCAFRAGTRDDVGFARALVAEISRTACVDSRRVYSTGMSNGGFMSYRLACEASDLFAAIAPVSAKVGIPDCNPTRSVPVLHFHGTADTIVPYSTGYLSGEKLDVPATIQRWVARDGCTKGPDVTYQNGTETCTAWSGCTDGASVTLCSDQGGQHCWPGIAACPFSPPTTDIDANHVMAAFFRSFALP